ncbi:hypothetical protein PBRA_004893 [Plasmodiophora brassicae]|nr:hypothetical protein PBRA_004893 [Plasmodiophora brassicae]
MVEGGVRSAADVHLYTLIIRQLADDGFGEIATNLSTVSGVDIDPKLPDNNLARIVTLAAAEDSQPDADKPDEAGASEPVDETEEAELEQHHPTRSPKTLVSEKEDAQDLSIDRESSSMPSRKFPDHSVRFVSLHKNAVRAGCFSPDGSYAATGSNDFSIKYLDVDKMHHHSQLKASKLATSDESASRPVIRTYYDHSALVTQVVFHPVRDILVSSSQDQSIKLFDLQRATQKRSFKQIRENSSVNSIDFHPTGDFLVCATDREPVYLYDMTTFQRFCSPDQKSFHIGPVMYVRYANQASYFASCGVDGTIKLWDGVSAKCVRTIPNAHSSAPVSNLQFSINGKYLLSGGRDSTSRLWEVATGRLVHTLEGAMHSNTSLRTVSIKSSFSYNDEFVLSGDELSGNITVWDTRTGKMVKKSPAHTKSVSWIATSQTEPAMLTCSEDCTAKFMAAQ